MTRPYCSHCKVTEGRFVRYSLSTTGWLHYCRKCHTERMRRYRNTMKGKLAARRAVRASEARHPDRQAARLLLNRAVRSGKLRKPKRCSVCLAKVRIEGHHGDYAKPLEVVWVCRGCHADIEKK